MNHPISSFMERQAWAVDTDDPVAEVESLFARARCRPWTSCGRSSATDEFQAGADDSRRVDSALPVCQGFHYADKSVIGWGGTRCIAFMRFQPRNRR